MSAYFAPVRRELAAAGFSQAMINTLEAMLTTASGAATAASDNAAQLASLQTSISSLQASVTTALNDADVALAFSTVALPAATAPPAAAVIPPLIGSATTSESLTAGAVCNLYASSGAKIQNANASDLTKPANRFVLSAYGASQVATYYLPGQYVTGLTLTPGATYWLSTTPGTISSTPPAAGLGYGSQIVGVADETGTRLFFDPQPINGI